MDSSAFVHRRTYRRKIIQTKFCYFVWCCYKTCKSYWNSKEPRTLFYWVIEETVKTLHAVRINHKIGATNKIYHQKCNNLAWEKANMVGKGIKSRRNIMLCKQVYSLVQSKQKSSLNAIKCTQKRVNTPVQILDREQGQTTAGDSTMGTATWHDQLLSYEPQQSQAWHSQHPGPQRHLNKPRGLWLPVCYHSLQQGWLLSQQVKHTRQTATQIYASHPTCHT